jgi:hypothetical protein
MRILLLVIAALSIVALPASAQDLFAKGNKRISIIAGAGESFDDDYFILGAGFGYYVIDGLELGINWQRWFSGDPEFDQVTPEITYVYSTDSVIDPYVGVLYRRLFIDGLDDLSGIGARAGVNIALGPRAYIGVGGVFIDYKSCDEETYVDCSESYPEITLSFLF